jgi:hypothetical protein
MGIKRFNATADNTITNAFEENLTTRGTGSNMGAADILEVFSIFAQASTSSLEAARTLIQFPITNTDDATNSIEAQRDAGNIPISGSVNFYLKLTNARHSQTVPKDYTLVVSAVSQSWSEGTGLDMENYSDAGASNWINGTLNPVASTITVGGTTTLNNQNGSTTTFTNADGTTHQFTADNTKTATQSTATLIGTSGISTTLLAVQSIYRALDAAITAGTLKFTLTPSTIPTDATVTDFDEIKLTSTVAGAHTTSITTGIPGFNGVRTSAGSGTQWFSQGGDYHAAPIRNQTFDNGTENLEVNVTEFVEEWIAGDKSNYGFGIQLTSSEESSTTRSYYTKRFFARTSEFFYRRPIIEARFNDARQDNRANFQYSSSLAPAADNLNTIWLYNRVRGRLTNIPDVGTGLIGVSIFSSSNGIPSSSALVLVADGAHVISTAPLAVTGGYVSTGIYSASFALTAASTPLTEVNDVWFKLDAAITNAADGTQYRTGSISPATLEASADQDFDQYFNKLTNLKTSYFQDEVPMLRLYARPKNWKPTIYTVAQGTPETSIIISSSYSVYRLADDLRVINFGTGSDSSTLMSYDTVGNYFELDMNMFEPDYAYGIELCHYNEYTQDWEIQPEVFKFRVEKRQDR